MGFVRKGNEAYPFGKIQEMSKFLNDASNAPSDDLDERESGNAEN